MTNERTVFRSERLREEYTKISHKSGLDIYVFPKKLTTTYAIFATRYGSVDTRFKLAGDSEFVEIPDGVAHFLEHKMFENMMRATAGRSVVFISHRLSSATTADRIYMLEKGRVIETGTHAELMAQNGKYADMFRKQAENYVGA